MSNNLNFQHKKIFSFIRSFNTNILKWLMTFLSFINLWVKATRYTNYAFIILFRKLLLIEK